VLLWTPFCVLRSTGGVFIARLFFLFWSCWSLKGGSCSRGIYKPRTFCTCGSIFLSNTAKKLYSYIPGRPAPHSFVCGRELRVRARPSICCFRYFTRSAQKNCSNWSTSCGVDVKKYFLNFLPKWQFFEGRSGGLSVLASAFGCGSKVHIFNFNGNSVCAFNIHLYLIQKYRTLVGWWGKNYEKWKLKEKYAQNIKTEPVLFL